MQFAKVRRSDVVQISEYAPLRRPGEMRMDNWDFLKWRRTLRYTQAEAAEKLGVNRGTIQNWERGATRISKAAELACQELTRRWKQHCTFGPVTLVYADNPLWQRAEGLYQVPVLLCERYSNNDGALEQASSLKGGPHFQAPFIIDENGVTIWAGTELLAECDRRRDQARAKCAATRDNQGVPASLENPPNTKPCNTLHSTNSQIEERHSKRIPVTSS